MLEHYILLQGYVLFGCGLVCCLLAFFVRTINFHSARKKKSLIKIELGVALLLMADAVTKIIRWDVDQYSYYMIRIAYFLLFACILANQYLLNQYLTVLFMEGGKFEKLPKRLLLGYILPLLGLVLVVLTPFLGLYYTVDANNAYHRGPLFLIAYIMPFLTLVLQFTFVVEHRNIINKTLFKSILVYSMLPVLAGVAQVFLRGVSLINFSMWVSAVVLFWFALLDQNEELSKAANTETMTGLPNTFGFQGEIDRIMSYGNITDYNGFYFDMVRMSQLNNKYGKTKGDEIIIKYSQGLRKELDKDEIIGRLGGNYFVALVKKTNTDKFLKLLSDYVVEIEYFGKTEKIHVSSVAGCYEIKSKNLPAGKILGCTSAAVTYAKNVAHKPYVFMDDKLEEEFRKDRQVEENTRKALNNNEFEPFYQPKVDSKRKTLVGAEALVRWRRVRQIVPPIEFVPVMEKNGSICDLDFYMFNRVCQDIRGWLNQGIEPVPISVNFSRRNLGNPSFAGEIAKIVEEYAIPTDLLQIEITETLDEYPMSAMVKVVEELHRYGLSTAIDDFGTGSSSIKLLKEVQFDVMKIDKSFVDYGNDIEKKILMDIIHMADNIGLDVVAEGVEEEAKVKELATMGCYEIQGYYFDKPLEKDVFEKKLLNKMY